MNYIVAKEGCIWVWTEKILFLNKNFSPGAKPGEPLSKKFSKHAPESWVKKGYIVEREQAAAMLNEGRVEDEQASQKAQAGKKRTSRKSQKKGLGDNQKVL